MKKEKHPSLLFPLLLLELLVWTLSYLEQEREQKIRDQSMWNKAKSCIIISIINVIKYMGLESDGLKVIHQPYKKISLYGTGDRKLLPLQKKSKG